MSDNAKRAWTAVGVVVGFIAFFGAWIGGGFLLKEYVNDVIAFFWVFLVWLALIWIAFYIED